MLLYRAYKTGANMPGIPVWFKETAEMDYPLCTEIFEITATHLINKIN